MDQLAGDANVTIVRHEIELFSMSRIRDTCAMSLFRSFVFGFSRLFLLSVS